MAFKKLISRSDMLGCILCKNPPCSAACKKGLDTGKLLRSIWFENEEFASLALPQKNPCMDCDAPCEKACIRNIKFTDSLAQGITSGSPVNIKNLLQRLYEARDLEHDVKNAESIDFSCLKSDICGKADGTVPEAGELSVETAVSVLEKVLFNSEKKEESGAESVPELPVRPPVLCAGCPHRGSFYAVKQAMKGKKTAYCGDIGCYTLGNAKPLDMTDTCLCMGADITMAQGFYHNENDRHCFSFIGDSTFFASGITGVINGVYNQARQTVCVLDNSTTAMTGHQPHPGTGMTMMGKTVEKLSIKKILEAAGVNPVLEADPFNQEQAVAAVKQASEAEGVSAVIFKAPCIAVASKLGYKFNGPVKVQAEKCIGCQKCIRELGCPALSVSSSVLKNGKHRAEIDASLCTGCGLCRDVCPVKAIC